MSDKITQMIDLGATRAQAIAALTASKGDVMSAMDRFFEGRYDHITDSSPEGQELPAELASPTSKPSSSRPIPQNQSPTKNPNGSSSSPINVDSGSGSGSGTDGDVDGDTNMDGDEDEDEDGDEGGSGSGDDGDFDMFEDDEEGEGDARGYQIGFLDGEEENCGQASDPYAHVFYSKDRVETLIEVEEPAITGTVAVPVAADGGGMSKEGYEIFASGGWMSGCPEKGEQSFLFQLYNQLSDGPMKCKTTGCKGVYERKPVNFFAIFQDFPTTLRHLKSTIRYKCPQCNEGYCLACGEGMPASTGNGGVSKGKGKGKVENGKDKGKGKRKEEIEEIEELLHCANIQGVLVGIGLHLAQKVHDTPLNIGSKILALAVPSKRKATPSSPYITEDDDDYPPYAKTGHIAKKGTGAGTGYSGPTGAEDTSGAKAAYQAQKQKDTALRQCLEQVRVYLPNHGRDGGPRPGDHMVHPVTLCHLRRRFNQMSCLLLQSDSISDVHDRSELYLELMEWMLILSRHDGLTSALAMPHMRLAQETRQTDPNGRIEKTIRYEGMASPRELLERIVIQCQQAVKTLDMDKQQIRAWQLRRRAEEKKLLAAVGAPADDDMPTPAFAAPEEDSPEIKEEEDVAKLRSFCEKIIKMATAIDSSLTQTKGQAFVNRMRASLPSLERKQKGSAKASTSAGLSEDEIKKKYIAWVEENRFSYIDLSRGEPAAAGGSRQWSHCFNNDIQAVTDGTVASKRTLALAKEMGTMSQNLPAAWDSSIFVRVDETRFDVIKAMIIGPAGSPYENGCYLFDIFMPANYNQTSPKCKIVSTFGGRHRHGPNLYAEGKVCLSLLGTWSGPGWVAGKSTLLQVLISIQALILGTPSPIACEPGHESYIGTERDDSYNANIRRMNVNNMIEVVTKPPPAFKDAIHGHFRLKASQMRKQLDEWEKIDDGAPLGGDSMSSVRSRATAATCSPAYKANLDKMKQIIDDLEAGKDPSAGIVGDATAPGLARPPATFGFPFLPAAPIPT